jgi:site-specific DNA recombinase
VAVVAVYSRLSLDSTGEQTATARQERACRLYAAKRGWYVGQVFSDVDVSAYNPRAVRDGYERLLTALGQGEFDGVLVWKLDRLVRRPSEFERVWQKCETARAFLASVTEPIDSSTAMGLALVRVLVTFANYESATLGLRLSAKFKQRAENGLAHGPAEAFGYTHGFAALVPDEAAAIREAAKRILAGESTSSVCLDWAERGIVTRRGKVWQANRLMELLCSPRLVGDRAWRGDVVKADCFPAVLDRRTHLRLRRLRASRAVGRYQRHERTLLSRLVVCEECGNRMHVRRNQHHRLYSCQRPPAGCGHVHVVGPLLEDYVTTELFDWLRSHPPPAPQRRNFDEAAYTELVQQLEELHHDYHLNRLMDRESYLSCRAELDHRLRSVATRSDLPAVEGLPRGFDLRYTASAWPVLTDAQRRSVMLAELQDVRISGARVRRFDPGRIQLHWRRNDPA